MKDKLGCLLSYPYFTSSAGIGLFMAADWALKIAPTNEMASQYALQIGLISFAAMYVFEKISINAILRCFDGFIPGYEFRKNKRRVKRIFDRSNYGKGSTESNETVVQALEEGRETFDNMIGKDPNTLLYRWLEGKTNVEESEQAERIRDNVMRQKAKKHGVRFEDLKAEMSRQLDDFFGDKKNK